MEKFHGRKGLEIIPSMVLLIGINLLGIIIIYLINSYLMLNLTKLTLIICNIFYIYHIGVWLTVKYYISEKGINITALGGVKKVILPIEDIVSYTTTSGRIKGIGLSGIYSNNFAIGRIAVKGLGTTRMFVTNSSKIFYLETKGLNYGISPKNFKIFEEKLKTLGVEERLWEKTYDEKPNLLKEWKFIVPITISTCCILWVTFGPVLLYVFNKLPDVMPLSLDAGRKVTEVGTDKQFAFTQMTYGLLNMAVFFCLYYAAQFCAKYDKKSAYNYIYGTMAVALIFLYIQVVLISHAI